MLVKESEYIDKTSVLLLCKRVITSERLLESFFRYVTGRPTILKRFRRDTVRREPRIGNGNCKETGLAAMSFYGKLNPV